MKKIFLLTTAHLEDGLWFREEDDFRVAMNYVAIQAASSPEVVVLAFVLMSNHVHFVVMGQREYVLKFINQFKHRYSLYFRRKYGIKEFLRGNGADIRPVQFEDEEVERAIAYVQMNPVAANICAHPSQYPWGTGNTFFSGLAPAGKRLDDYSARALQQILRSECDSLPGDWTIGEGGYIYPFSYVDVKAVEEIFHTPRRMNYFLNSSSKAKKRMESADDNLPAFRDQSILAAMPDLCRSLFKKAGFEELSPEEQTEFARQLRFRFSADANQIARVCGITYAQAAQVLDNI